MKKITGIFSILLIAGTMLFNVILSSNSKTDIDLASIIATTVANAEEGYNGCFYSGWYLDNCNISGTNKMYCQPTYMYLSCN